jgi:nicotinate-nucleotide pyrophosphorylase (carboxylating)
LLASPAPCSPKFIGSITAAIQAARRVGGFSLLLDVEVGSEQEGDEAIGAGADIVMLDNIEGSELIGVARRLREKWEGKRKFLFESSGNITEANLQERAIPGTQSARRIAHPLNWEPVQRSTS